LLVFAATSAETMIPRSMEKLERLVMPTGFTFNMDGTAIYMSIGILFLAHTLKVHLTVTEQFTTFLVMLFTSKGAAGVTGGGFVALAATLPAVYGRNLGCHQPDQQCHRDAGCGSMQQGGGLRPRPPGLGGPAQTFKS
jgi:Na+/H+-dicarboxylate symporter